MREKEVVALLRRKVEEVGGQRAFAKICKLSAPYVNDVFHGKRHPGPKILKALGLKAKVIREYEVR